MKLWTPQRRFFPDPAHTLADGLVAIGDDLSNELLLEAYSFGIFPWPQEGLPILWFCPDPRGVLDFQEFHLSRRFQRFLRQSDYEMTVNRCFSEVIQRCAQAPRPDQEGTWINVELTQAYIDFHHAGLAHSIECWMQGELVGGLYGVYVGGVFSGESMFFERSNASKLCLLHLVQWLKAQGQSWMDIQMVTDHLESLGGKYIRRKDFLERLHKEHQDARPLDFALFS